MSCVCSRWCQGIRHSTGSTRSTSRYSPDRRGRGRRLQSTQSQASSSQSTSFQSTSSSNTNLFPMPTSKRASPYDIFHLSRSSTSAEIKARYYELVKLTHPDRILAQSRETFSSSKDSDVVGITPEKANEDFKRVREAYNILGNERKRRLYDHSGMGWDPINHSGMDTGGGFGPMWKGGFPTTARERAEYEAWSSSLRRGAPGSMNRKGWEFRGQGQGHDRHGWQHYAGNSKNMGSDWFYGHGHARDYANPKQEPMYTTNNRFFITLTFLTTVLGIGQYMRLKEESRTVVGVADRQHQSAAKSLDEARHFARSDAGRTRFDEMKKRARGMSSIESKDLDAESGWTNVGHGGPNGREAYEGRMNQLGWETENSP